jgi:hypothetical protein
MSMVAKQSKQKLLPALSPFLTWAGDPGADAPGARRLHALKGLGVEHA